MLFHCWLPIAMFLGCKDLIPRLHPAGCVSRPQLLVIFKSILMMFMVYLLQKWLVVNA